MKGKFLDIQYALESLTNSQNLKTKSVMQMRENYLDKLMKWDEKTKGNKPAEKHARANKMKMHSSPY